MRLWIEQRECALDGFQRLYSHPTMFIHFVGAFRDPRHVVSDFVVQQSRIIT